IVRRRDVYDVDVVALDQLAPIGLDRLVAPLARELLRGLFIAPADGLQDDFVIAGEEMPDLGVRAGVSPAHEAVADESDAKLFLGHEERMRVILVVEGRACHTEAAWQSSE